MAVLLDQNIAGEQCAITTYKGLMDATKDKDMVTYNLALTILEQEVEHEEDLQSLQGGPRPDGVEGESVGSSSRLSAASARSATAGPPGR